MKKILIVDDDSRMLKLIKGYLEEFYTVYPVRGGSDALAFLDENIPDAIILDYVMPALDGPHTLELIRKKDGCSDIPVIFLTGVTNKDKVEECMAYSPYSYMVKPVAKEELLLKLGEVFSEKD